MQRTCMMAAVTTLKELNPHAGDIVRRMLKDRNDHYYPEPIVWRVLKVVDQGCIVALASGQGHAPHKHLMDWSTRVES